jgi:hypothetical protein
MRYRDMRALFAQLPDDGRLTLHLAFRQTYRSPWAADAVAPPWTVVVRDNARRRLPGTDVRYLYRVTGAGLAGPDDRAIVAGLCILDATADPTCRLTWPEVLRVLDGISAAFPAWQIEAIVGTLEPEPRHSVTLWTEARQARPLPSAEAFDRLCLEAGPLGQRAPIPDVPAVAAGARPNGRMQDAPTWEPSPRGGAAASAGRLEPVTAWVFTPRATAAVLYPGRTVSC